MVAQLRKEFNLERERTRAEENKREERFITGEELREREARKCNIIMHRVKELAQIYWTAEERRRQDMEECGKVRAAIGIESNQDISFCRRIGEEGVEPRLLVVILRTEEIKKTFLDRAKNLRDSVFNEVGLVPDLTPRQRKEEQSMSEEVEKKNEEELTDEDNAKNLRWLLVGPRGARRIIKGVPREYQSRRGTGGNRGGVTHRGRGRPRARGGIMTAGNNTTMETRRNTGQNEAVQLVRELLPPRELLPTSQTATENITARTRMGSKRMREDGMEMETEAGKETEEEEDFRSPGRSPARKK